MYFHIVVLFFPTENKRAAMQCQNADAAAKVTLLARRREK